VDIILTDNGCGIPKKDQAKIFAPFFTTKKQGSGLGLGISKSIIEEHEGCSFTVQSQEGKGTTFKIHMPIHRPAMKDKTAKSFDS
jgi:signal transduction histidine kinase